MSAHAGGKVTRDAGPVKGGTSLIAFVEDNTGYKWELIQKSADFLAKKRDPVLHVRVPEDLAGTRIDHLMLCFMR